MLMTTTLKWVMRLMMLLMLYFTVRATNMTHTMKWVMSLMLLIDVVNVVFQLGVDTVRATNMTHTMKWVMSLCC